MSEDREHEFRPGDPPLAGRYRMRERLGSGGMADVYLAEDEALGRLVAVKVLKAKLAANDELVERFRIEAWAAASLNHPNIVTVYDRGTADGATYIAMEYVSGESLKQRLRREGSLPASEATRIALQVLSALEAAHERSIVHRDVTSYNVLLDDQDRVKVTDFGIARMGESALTRTGAMMGTSSYLSPEQAQGRPADERSDLYSLGVVLYEMLTGRVPFRGDSDVAVAMQHVSAAPANPRSLVAGVPEPLAAVVMRALSKDPAHRYQSAGEFAAALRQASGGRGGGDSGRAPARPAAAAGGPAPAAPARSAAADAATAPARKPSTPAPPGPTAVAADAPTRYQPSRATATTVRPRRRRRRTLLVVVVLLLIAAAAGWAAYALLFSQTRVPELIGRDRADAAAAVRGEGLKPELHYVWSDGHATGTVVRQRPRAHAKVEDGTEVDLWVSRGPLHIPAPDLTGLAAGVAQKQLSEASLSGVKHRGASRKTPKGQIFKQEPAAGETVRRGDTVTFWVSSGPPALKVPDVVGLSSGDATDVLEAKGLAVSTDYVAGWGEMPGDVVGQDPVAGTRVREGDEVIIQVAVF